MAAFRWPWTVRRSERRLTLRASADLFAWVLTDPAEGQDLPPLVEWGALTRNDDEDAEAFAKRARALGLAAGEVIALLEPDQYQLLKVETPNVPNEELKAAARWQIKELVDAHLDDLTLDVMHVGDDTPRAQRQLFVVTARNAAITALTGAAEAAGANPNVVDIWETALRNLQSAQAARDQMRERACAALLLQDRQCLLTVSVNDELFYTRRLDGDDRLAARATGAAAPRVQVEAPLGFEYTPGVDLNAAYGGDSEESALIVELQRSIDVWERSWPDLPLARLYLVAPEHGAAVAALMQRELGLRTVALEPAALFPGLLRDAGDTSARAAELAACLPLLGACLRAESRKL